MYLFERIDKVVELTVGSRIKFAKRLGLPPTTLNGYFVEERQNNFWPILPNILKEFPNISREWLYFEEGYPEKQTPGGETVTIPQAQPEPKYATDIVKILKDMANFLPLKSDHLEIKGLLESIAVATMGQFEFSKKSNEEIISAIRENKIKEYEKALEHLRQDLRDKEKRIADLEDDQIRLQTRVEGKLLRLVPDDNGCGGDGEKVA
jgi:hypothetical protein